MRQGGYVGAGSSGNTSSERNQFLARPGVLEYETQIKLLLIYYFLVGCFAIAELLRYMTNEKVKDHLKAMLTVFSNDSKAPL